MQEKRNYIIKKNMSFKLILVSCFLGACWWREMAPPFRLLLIILICIISINNYSYNKK